MDSRNVSINGNLNATSEFYLEAGNFNLPFGLLGCIMNGFVCFIIAYHKCLRQPFNYLILNLSISDFLVSLSVILNSILNYTAAAAINQLSSISNIANITCKFIIFCAISSFSSTCLTLLAISFERYQCITTKRRRTMKLLTVRIAIMLTWLFAGLSSIILAYLAESDATNYNCTVGAISELWVVIIFFTLSFLTTVLPILLMVLLYIHIIFKLFRKIQVSDLNPSSIIEPQRNYLRRSIIVIIIISIFTCSTGLPYILLHAIAVIGDYVSPNFRQTFLYEYEALWTVASVLFLGAPVVNPLLYNFASRQFRKVLFKYFSSHCCCPSKRKR